ncbi:MAG: hypothetical protein ACLPKB_00920 [Xanthobacteraceae bacterium]
MGRSAALVAAALMLAACTSLADLDMSKALFHAVDQRTIDLQLESEPAGAEAKTSLGPSCRTPCTLPILPGPNFTVTFTLDGYQPQTLSVEVIRANARPDWDGNSRTDHQLAPNPAHVDLVAIPPPEPPKPPPAKKKPRVTAKPVTAAPSNKDQTSSAGFPPASSASFAPPPR